MTKFKEKLFLDKPAHTVTYEYISSHQNTVLEGLCSLREDGLLFDITLIVESQLFRAHKTVLSACSDYFRAMFTDSMLESRQNEIALNGLTAAGFGVLLEYAYTARLALNQANVQDVLSCAAHVQMLTVVQACSTYLQSQIEIENCVDIATIAENFVLPQLKRTVYMFMSGCLLEFSTSHEFYRLSPQQLETLLAYDFPVDCPEVCVFSAVLHWFFHVDNSAKQVCLEYAARILRRVNFKEIPGLKTIIDEFFRNRQYEQSLYKIVVTEAYRHISPLKTSIRNNLLNSRGMEMALLKIGGFGVGGITNEITYCLSSGHKWRHLTSIPHVEQCNFGTAVLHNKLYVVGGCFNQSLQENIHPFGFKYSPRFNKWSTMAPMNTERCRFSLNVVDSCLYAVGGASEVENFDDVNDETSTGEFYDPVTDKWENIPPLMEHRAQHAGASYECGRDIKWLFISGGMDKDVVLSSVCCYNTVYSTWKNCARMLTPRADHVMLSVGHKLYVCGGWREDRDTRARVLVDTIDAYDVLRNEWEVVTQVPTPRYHAGIVGVCMKIYFIGGFHSDAIFDRDAAAIECYDIETNTWTTEDKYPQVIWEHTCATLYVPKCRDDMEVLDFT